MELHKSNKQNIKTFPDFILWQWEENWYFVSLLRELFFQWLILLTSYNFNVKPFQERVNISTKHFLKREKR